LRKCLISDKLNNKKMAVVETKLKNFPNEDILRRRGEDWVRTGRLPTEGREYWKMFKIPKERLSRFMRLNRLMDGELNHEELNQILSGLTPKKFDHRSIEQKENLILKIAWDLEESDLLELIKDVINIK
jgi:hypothetical protein